MASGLYIGGGPPLGLPIVTSLNASDYLAADVSAGQNARAISVANFLAQVSEDTIGTGGAALTPGTIPKAIAASPWLADSILVEDTSKIGVGGTPLLKFDVIGSNAKATTAAVEYLASIRSSDAADPLRLRFGIKTDATGTSRYGTIGVEDAGSFRNLLLNPNGGNVGVGIEPAAKLDVKSSSWGRFQSLDSTSSNVYLYGDPAGGWFAGYRFKGSGGTALGGLFGVGSIDSPSYYTIGSAFATGLSISHTSSNVGIGTPTFGSSAVRVFALLNGTEPGALADTVQMLAKDIVAGNSAPHFVTEAGPVIRLYQQAHIADPAGGGTIDAEARTAINAILVAIENTRLLATS